jgi:hypothetical protein
VKPEKTFPYTLQDKKRARKEKKIDKSHLGSKKSQFLAQDCFVLQVYNISRITTAHSSAQQEGIKKKKNWAKLLHKASPVFA